MPEPDVRFSLANERTLLAYQRTAIGGYRRYRAADRAIRGGRPLPKGATPLLISLGLVICLLIAADYVITTLR